MVLKTEASALKKLQENPYVVRCISFGREEEYNFLVMERLQDNLADLRKRSKNTQFTLFTTVKCGIQLNEAIKEMHKLGYIHRDVKPHNFVTGRKNKGKIYVIDFGLARKYIGPDGEHRPPRNQPGFKGTARYASLNSHKLSELSRRDDMISIFYMLVEFYKGSLPWAGNHINITLKV
jgi:tau tubulin kinase